MKVLRSTFVEGGNKIDILTAHGNWNQMSPLEESIYSLSGAQRIVISFSSVPL